MNRCCICEKRIIGTDWTCGKCAKTYNLIGKKYADWPGWVKGIKQLEHQRREKLKQMLDAGFIEISYETIEDLEAMADMEVISEP